MSGGSARHGQAAVRRGPGLDREVSALRAVFGWSLIEADDPISPLALSSPATSPAPPLLQPCSKSRWLTFRNFLTYTRAPPA